MIEDEILIRLDADYADQLLSALEVVNDEDHDFTAFILPLSVILRYYAEMQDERNFENDSQD